MSRHKAPDPAAPRRSDVGYCKPPTEHQWAKGHCPNPAGRGGKKVNPQPSPSIPSELERAILNFFRTPMGEADPAETTRFQYQLRKMHLSAENKTEYGKLLLTLVMGASNSEAQWKALVLREALAHKDEWGAKFAEARMLGRAEPAIYPHPDDIIVHGEGTVEFDGPITADDARQLKALLDQRDTTFSVIHEINEQVELDVDLRREMWTVIRRKYYRYSPCIPRRLKRPFPGFEPRVA